LAQGIPMHNYFVHWRQVLGAFTAFTVGLVYKTCLATNTNFIRHMPERSWHHWVVRTISEVRRPWSVLSRLIQPMGVEPLVDTVHVAATEIMLSALEEWSRAELEVCEQTLHPAVHLFYHR